MNIGKSDWNAISYEEPTKFEPKKTLKKRKNQPSHIPQSKEAERLTSPAEGLDSPLTIVVYAHSPDRASHSRLVAVGVLQRAGSTGRGRARAVETPRSRAANGGCVPDRG